MKHRDATKWLCAEYEARKLKNRRYSLRAFAKLLRVGPGHLSDILAYRRGISLPVAEKICSRLKFDAEERAGFLKLVSNQALALSRRKRLEHLGKGAPKYECLHEAQLNQVSDWYLFAILALIETADFRNDPQWIAARLGLNVKETSEAVARLIRLGMAREMDDKLTGIGKWEICGDSFSRALLGVLEQFTTRAIALMNGMPAGGQDISTITFPGDPDKVSIAKDLIKIFRKQIAALMSDEDRREVYSLAILFTPVTISSRDGEIS